MKGRSWQLREAQPSDDAALVQLFNLVTGFKRSLDQHLWRFRENIDGPPMVMVAEDKGTIVGQYALWPTRLRCGAELVLGAQSLDTMTHPAYRGQGMFTVLAEECMRVAATRGVEALYGFPNENSQPGFVRKLDWDCTGDVPVWIRPLAISRHPRVPTWIGPLADMAVALLPKGRVGSVEVRHEVPTAGDQEALLKISGHGHDSRCCVERTAQRYAWRLSERSGMRYRWIAAYRADRILAAAAWGVDVRTGNAVLAELLAEDSDAAEVVLASAVRDAAQAKCPLLMAVSSRQALEPVLRRCGFVRRGGFPLIVRKLTIRTLGANVHTHANWELFGADLDTF